MAVYLFTFHTYRSWMPDHKRGYVKRKRGIQPSDAEMGENYTRRARWDRVMLDDDAKHVAIDAARRVCEQPAREDWELHTVVAVFNHVHLLVSWRKFVEAERVKSVLHRAINVDLRDALGYATGRKVLSRGGSRKRVYQQSHYDHLVHHYLPSHRKYRGVLYVAEKTRTADGAATKEVRDVDGFC